VPSVPSTTSPDTILRTPLIGTVRKPAVGTRAFRLPDAESPLVDRIAARRSAERDAQRDTVQDVRARPDRSRDLSKQDRDDAAREHVSERASQGHRSHGRGSQGNALHGSQRSIAQAIAGPDQPAPVDPDNRTTQGRLPDTVADATGVAEPGTGQQADAVSNAAVTQDQLQTQLAEVASVEAIQPQPAIPAAHGDPSGQNTIVGDQISAVQTKTGQAGFAQRIGASEGENIPETGVAGDAAQSANAQSFAGLAASGTVLQGSLAVTGDAQSTDASSSPGAVGSTTSGATQASLLANLRATTAKSGSDPLSGETAGVSVSVSDKQDATIKSSPIQTSALTENDQKHPAQIRAETAEARFADAFAQRADTSAPIQAGPPVTAGTLLTGTIDSVLDARQGVVPETKPTPIHAVPMEIGFRALQGQKRFDIRLDPGDLGRVDVRLEISDDGAVSARLTVDRVETLHLLQRDAKSLEYAFEQAGLKPSDSSVDIQLRDRSLDFGGSQNRQKPEDIPQRMIRAAIADEDAQTALHPSTTRMHRASTRGVDIVI
jgi:flagellar hook-length control protein FliK